MEMSRHTNGEYGNIELSYNFLMDKISENNFELSKIRMLDLGTNMGSLPYLIHTRHSADVTGVDLDARQIANGQKKYPEIADRLVSVDSNLDIIRDESFDVIMMFDVIEHIPEVEKYLKGNVYRILKKNGLFVFQTPNKRINPIYEIIQGKSFTRWKEYHCSLQTPKSLKNILVDAGFDRIYVEKYRIDSDYNKEKIRRYAGPLTGALFAFFQSMPLGLYPNLWGTARKSVRE